MARSSARTRTIWLAIALGAAAACGEYEAASDTDTDTATEVSAIYNGVPLGSSELAASGLVAIYHPKDPSFPNFYPRPCSGVIVRAGGGQSTVLTARHCVTTDNTIYGPLVDPSRLRLTPTLSPGPALPDPPANAVPGWVVIDKLGPVTDIAVVSVLTDWSSNRQQPHRPVRGRRALAGRAIVHRLRIRHQRCRRQLRGQQLDRRSGGRALRRLVRGDECRNQ